MKNILLINRRPHPGQFSIEGIFYAIGQKLQKNGWNVRQYQSPMYSKGIIPRLYNGIHIMFRQKNICHIVGDVTYLALFLRRRRLVLTFHDLSIFERKTGLARYLIGLIWYRLPIKRARYITTISEFSRSLLIKHFGVTAEQVSVIPNPVSSKFKFLNKNPIDKNSRIDILQIGTKENKNLNRVVEALKLLSAKYNFRLTIIGKLTNTELLKCADKLEIENLNNVTLEEIISFYQRSHIVMFASTYEGFGMPLIEGQSVGRPVITSNIEPLKSLSNGAALLVNPYFVNEIAIAIEELIKKPELVDKLVELGLDNVKKYSIETISDQYSSIYEMLT